MQVINGNWNQPTQKRWTSCTYTLELQSLLVWTELLSFDRGQQGKKVKKKEGGKGLTDWNREQQQTKLLLLQLLLLWLLLLLLIRFWANRTEGITKVNNPWFCTVFPSFPTLRPHTLPVLDIARDAGRSKENQSWSFEEAIERCICG